MAGISTRLRASAPALIALLIACLAPAAARGATYDITSCNGDGTAAGWSSYGGASFQSGIVCPYNGDLTSRGFGVANAVNVGLAGYASGGLIFKPPPGTSLAGIGTGLRVQRWDASYWAGLATGSGQMLAGFWANDGNGANAGTYSTHSWFNLNRESNIHLEVGCGGMCDTAWMAPAGFRAWAQLFDPITVRIEDDEAPAESLTGGSLVANAYAAGVQALTYNASDASGIRATRLYVDGSKLRDDTRSCNFEQPVPCSGVSGGSYTVDTTALVDGSHSVKVETVDAAGNVASQSRTISVDNHAPGAPALTVAGGEAWRNANDFAVSWANPAGQVAPIAKAHYQLCRADQPGDCEPAGVQTSSSSSSSLSGLSVPREGDYTLTVWLEDAAGNTSVTDASAPVHLRYDSGAPGRISGITVAGGEDWRSTNSFDLTWTNPSEQLAPVTAAHYRLCGEDGSCTTGVRSGSDSLDGLRVPGPGSYALTLWVEDAAGNTDPSAASAPVSLRFDDTDPGQAEPQPSDGWLNATSVADGYDETIRDAVVPPSGIAGFAVSVGGSEPGTSPNVGPDGVLHIAELPEGPVTVKARAISISGVASSRVGSAVLYVDKSGPEVSLSGAPDPDAWQPEAVTVQLRGTDALSGMEHGRIAYSVDGGPQRTADGGAAEVTVDEDGAHTIDYSATDAAGNSSAERTVSFKLDSTPPGDAALADPGRWLNATEADEYEQPLALADPASKPLSGLDGYSVTTDGSLPDESVDARGESFALDSLDEGTTVVKARAVSGSGLASTRAASVALHVDRTAPDVVLRGVADDDSWQHEGVHLSAEASDALSGMEGGHLEYSVDGSDRVVVAGGSASIAVNGDGPHTVRYAAVDAAGNRAEEKEATFRIDGEEPGMAQPASSEAWVTDAVPYVEHVALADGEALPLSGLAGFSVTTDGSVPDDRPDVDADGVLTLSDLPDGVTTVKARAVSGAGVASDVVGSGTIKVDRTAPDIGLQRGSTNIAASVSDATSGLASASVEYRAGSGGWISLPAQLQGGTLTAKLEGLAPGMYSLRARATDVAGNERTVTRFTDGSSATATVDPPAHQPIEASAPTPPAAVAAPSPAPVTRPAKHKATARCTVKGKHSKRSHRHKHHRGRAKHHAKPCARSHHKGGEKHRSHHLGGKTHKHARRNAGQRKDPK